MAHDLRESLRSHDLSLLGAGVTFYAVVAAVPLSVVSLRLAGWIGGRGAVEAFARAIDTLLPHSDAAHAGQALASAALHVPWPVLVASVLPASLYADGLRRALSRLAAQQRENSLRRAARSRLLALAGFLFLSGSLLGVASAGAVLTDGRLPLALAVYLAFLGGWVLATAALIVAYRISSSLAVSRTALLTGAAATGSVVSGMTLGLILVLRLPLSSGRAYGGFATAGVAATAAGWLWLLHMVVLAGFAYTHCLAARLSGATRRPGASPARRAEPA